MPWINLNKEEINYIKNNLGNGGIPINPNMAKIYYRIFNKLKKVENPIKVRSAKNKGLLLQKWVCERISKLINIPYDQSNDQCLIHSREASQIGVDIILRGNALRLFPFSIECKSSEQFNIKKSIEQAKNNQVENTDWMIVYKRKSFKKPVVIIDWGIFDKIWKG